MGRENEAAAPNPRLVRRSIGTVEAGETSVRILGFLVQRNGRGGGSGWIRTVDELKVVVLVDRALERLELARLQRVRAQRPCIEPNCAHASNSAARNMQCTPQSRVSVSYLARLQTLDAPARSSGLRGGSGKEGA